MDWSLWRTQLAQHTRAAHHQLDHHPVMQPLLSNALTRAEYTSAQLVFAHIWPRFAQQFDWAAPVARAIEQDLALFEARAAIAALPNLPNLSGAAGDAWQYVMWGSTRGGSVIARHLKKVLPDHPHFFFTALGGIDTVPFLPQFTADQCGAAAIDCFHFWIEVCDVVHRYRAH